MLKSVATLAALAALSGCATPLPSAQVDAGGVVNSNSLQNGVYLGADSWTLSENNAIRRSVADLAAEGATVTGPDSTFAFEFGENRRMVSTTDVRAQVMRLFGSNGQLLAEFEGFDSSASATNASAAALFATVRDAYNALTPVMQQQLIRDLEAIKVVSPTVGAAVDALIKAITGGL